MNGKIPGKLFVKFNLACIFIAVCLLSLPAVSNARPSATYLSFGVTFGQPQSNGGPCVGKGVCRENFDANSNNTYPNAPEAVTVVFQVSADDPNVLMMSFSLSELTQKQPEQVANFVDGGSYTFDAAYILSNAVYGQLNLLPNAQILPSSPSTVKINGDFVTDYITYSHSAN